MYTLYAVNVANNGAYTFTELMTGSRGECAKEMNVRTQIGKSLKSALYLGRHFVSSTV